MCISTLQKYYDLVIGAGGVAPSEYLVQFQLFCCWGSDCCFVVAVICKIFESSLIFQIYLAAYLLSLSNVKIHMTGTMTKPVKDIFRF